MDDVATEAVNRQNDDKERVDLGETAAADGAGWLHHGSKPAIYVRFDNRSKGLGPVNRNK